MAGAPWESSSHLHASIARLRSLAAQAFLLENFAKRSGQTYKNWRADAEKSIEEQQTTQSPNVDELMDDADLDEAHRQQRDLETLATKLEEKEKEKLVRRYKMEIQSAKSLIATLETFLELAEDMVNTEVFDQ